MRGMRLIIVAGVLAALAGSAVADGVAAITRPSEDVTLSFVRPGRVAEVLVREGDIVTAGQVVARQDDEAELAQVAQLKAQAEDTVRIRAAEAQREQKQVEYGKLQEAFERKAVSRWDVERAKLDVTIAELSVEMAKFQHDQDGLKYAEARIQAERMKIVSPISGRVEKIMVRAGESADEKEDVIRIVKIDPLWVDAPVPIDVARRLKAGGEASVGFPGGAVAGPCKIVHIGAVADAASDTLTVRVEVANPAGRMAGEHVTVSFK